MAERLSLLAMHTRPGLRAARLDVGSAGTHARPGAPMHPPVTEVLGKLGADTGNFRSRPLTGSLIARSTVVLTATRAQRSAVATLVPAAVQRVFTVRQFGRLVSAIGGDWAGDVPPAARLSELVARMPRARAVVGPTAAIDDELADPVNGTLDDVWRCAHEIERALAPVWAVIERR